MTTSTIVTWHHAYMTTSIQDAINFFQTLSVDLTNLLSSSIRFNRPVGRPEINSKHAELSTKSTLRHSIPSEMYSSWKSQITKVGLQSVHVSNYDHNHNIYREQTVALCLPTDQW